MRTLTQSGTDHAVIDQVSVADVSDIKATFSSRILEHSDLTALGGWFDVDFRGSASAPTAKPVQLSTAPPSSTHWGQQVFLLDHELRVAIGDIVEGTLHLTRQKVWAPDISSDVLRRSASRYGYASQANHRLLATAIEYRVVRPGEGIIHPPTTLHFRID